MVYYSCEKGDSMSNNIIVIVGPTGVGKTKVSVQLAKMLNGEIINADSMQVYKELDIGTAKIKEEEKEGIPHHLFDIVNIEDMYTIYDYQKDCRRIIDDIIKRGKTPIIVGGSGLYIRAALYDYKFSFEEQKEDFSNLTNEELLKRCKEIDANCDIHVNNRKRLERFLNKALNEGKIVSNSKPIYNYTMIGLTTDRDNLYKIINKRVDKMVDEGLLQEVKKFYVKKIYSKAILTGIGYKELYSYFENKIDIEESIEEIKKNSRHLAKRQYTFFNNQFKDVNWFYTNYQNINETINNIYKFISDKNM